jgi:hypothetical protein
MLVAANCSIHTFSVGRLPSGQIFTSWSSAVLAVALMPSNVERVRVVDQHRHRAEQTEVADAVRDEGLLAGRGVLLFGEPEADQQVAAEADALPADEQDGQAVAEDQHQHREDEQVEVREEAVVPRVVLHVLARVQVDEEAHPRHDEHHRRGHRVGAEADLERDHAAGDVEIHPAPGGPLQLGGHRGAVLGGGQAEEGDDAGEERQPDRRERHQPHGVLAEPLAEHAVHEGAEQRQQQHHAEQREVVFGELVRERVHVAVSS